MLTLFSGRANLKSVIFGGGKMNGSISVWYPVIFVVLIWFLSGAIGAYLNYHSVERRRFYLDKLNELRLNVFNSGLKIRVSVDKSWREIGIDEDWIFRYLKDKRKVSELILAEYSDSILRSFIVLSFIVGGVTALVIAISDHIHSKRLGIMYKQCKDAVDFAIKKNEELSR